MFTGGSNSELKIEDESLKLRYVAKISAQSTDAFAQAFLNTQYEPAVYISFNI